MQKTPSLLVLVLMVTLVPTFASLPSTIKIGAIFSEDEKGSPAELAFRYAVFQLNRNRTLLTDSTIMYDLKYVALDDSFQLSRRACDQVEFGASAFIGPTDPFLGSHLGSVSSSLGIPLMEARVDTEPKSPMNSSSKRPSLAVNLFPTNHLLAKSILDLIQFLNWTRVAVIYDDDFDLIKLQGLIQGGWKWSRRHPEITLSRGEPPFYRNALRDIKEEEIFNIVVDTSPLHISTFLRGLLQLQMNDDRYHYIFTSFDLETVDLEDMTHNGVNITAFRLVDSGNPRVKSILNDMERFQPVGHSLLNRSGVLQAQAALLYDSVEALARGLRKFSEASVLNRPSISCRDRNPPTWSLGSEVFQSINQIEFDGLTGPVKFKDGQRSTLKLDILKLRPEGLVKVGEWRHDKGINVSTEFAFYHGRAPNVTLRVTTMLEVPYVMLKEDSNATGNDQYQGFCIDLLKHIAQMLRFNYIITPVKDRKYGVYDPENKTWDGMVQELIVGEADLAVAAMTINYARESVIDFTKPFMNLGIAILFKIPTQLPTSQPTRLFSFMNPLAIEIWLYIMAAYILVSFAMFVMARFSPYEWNNPHPCNTESDVVENQFSISNSFWFITGTLLKQTSGLSPKAASTRLVGAIWWFFTLIIISSYTANLAAFLTVDRMITPIEDAEDLAEQDDIAYGTLKGGSTETFFRDSKLETYVKMWKFMESAIPSVFVSSYEEGVERVLKGNYAFLMESTMLEYIVQRNCNLTQVGTHLDSKGYGIATPINSPWRDKISLAILELQEKGVLQMLFTKWWKNTGDTCNRDDKSKDNKANALGRSNIGGVFVVLITGLTFSIIVAMLEFCWVTRRNANSSKQPMCREMKEELKMVLRCSGSRPRPNAIKRSCSRCMPSSTYVPSAGDPHQENGIMPMFEMHRSSIMQYDFDS